MVLDSKTILVLLRGQSNHGRVVKALEEPCCITMIGLAELLAQLPSVTPRALMEDLSRLGVEVVVVDSSLIADAAKLLASGASTEVAFAISLARQWELEVLFAERTIELPADWKVKVNGIG